MMAQGQSTNFTLGRIRKVVIEGCDSRMLFLFENRGKDMCWSENDWAGLYKGYSF
jgi:hypothetical protein